MSFMLLTQACAQADNFGPLTKALLIGRSLHCPLQAAVQRVQLARLALDLTVAPAHRDFHAADVGQLRADVGLRGCYSLLYPRTFRLHAENR